MEQAIKENRQRIEVLKIENMKDNARSLSQQMTIVKKLSTKRSGKGSVAAHATKLAKKLANVQKRIKKEMDRSAEFNIWGFNSYVVSYVTKCRVLEDLVDCAQRNVLKPDAESERELHLLRLLQK